MNPRIQELEDILENLLESLQKTLESGEILPDKLLSEVAKEITELTNEINELHEEGGEEQPQPGQEPPQQTPNEAPISGNAELLWILSGGQPQAFVSYLREFPDPSLANLLNNPDLLARTIERLQENEPQNRNRQQDGIPQAPLQSSNVYGFRFSPQNKKLQVRFNSGSVYEYDNVPEPVFNLFSHGNASAKTQGKNQWGTWWRGKNPSLGAALNQYIKGGGYNYRRLR